jgi:hypothetical protein
MFTDRTVIVVGAGASKEFGLPLGVELIEQIGWLLKIKSQPPYLQLNSDSFTKAFRMEFFEELKNKRIDSYIPKFERIKRAMPLSVSIDNFFAVDNDPEIERICKIAISNVILSAESKSDIYADIVNYPNNVKREISKKHWIHALFQKLQTGITRANIDEFGKNCKIISFNYDRSITHYITIAIMDYFSISFVEARTICNQIEIIYPYGSLGDAEYGDCSIANIVKASKSIQTFTEQKTAPTNIERMKEAVLNSTHMIMLGYGFHRQNLELLQPNEQNTTLCQVICTAYKANDEEKAHIVSLLKNLCRNSHLRSGHDGGVIFNTDGCWQLFGSNATRIAYL